MKKLLLLTIVLMMTIPILFHGIEALISIWNRIHVKDDFYIEYTESCSSIELHNGKQGFLCDIKEAYWNNDSLVISGNTGCFLIEFGKTKYNDEMTEIICDSLIHRIKNKPFKKYIKSKN